MMSEQEILEYKDMLRRRHEDGWIELAVPIVSCGMEAEYLWCRPVSPTTARVGTVPSLTDSVSRGDLVEFEGDKITGVPERRAWTWLIVPFDRDRSEIDKLSFLDVFGYLAEHDIQAAPEVHGSMLTVAVPTYITRVSLVGIAYRAPHGPWHVSPPVDHDRFGDAPPEQRVDADAEWAEISRWMGDEPDDDDDEDESSPF